MDNLFTQKAINANSVFDNRFLDGKILYLYYFNRLPNLSYISQIDGEKLFNALKEKFAGQIKNILGYRWYKKKNKEYQFGRTVLVFEGNCLIEIATAYCDIL